MHWTASALMQAQRHHLRTGLILAMSLDTQNRTNIVNTKKIKVAKRWKEKLRFTDVLATIPVSLPWDGGMKSSARRA